MKGTTNDASFGSRLGRSKGIRLALGLVLVGALAVPFVYDYADKASLETGIRACLDGRDALKLQCLEELVLSTVSERSVVAGLDLVAELYGRDRDFAAQCHANLHQIGDAAYFLYARGDALELNQKTQYCGFGFYHGFLEAMLQTEGNPEGARDFCNTIDSRGLVGGSATACFHGLGHGVTDGTDPTRWGDAAAFVEPGLTLCAQVAETDMEKERCGTGVFNSLAIAYRDEGKYRLGSDPDDPYAFCRSVEDPVYKKACYDQMNTYALLTQGDLVTGLGTILRDVEEGYLRPAIEGLASYAAREALIADVPVSSLREACATLQADLADLCIDRVVAGLFEFGKPEEEYLTAARFCADSEAFRTPCLNSFRETVAGVYALPMQRKACTHLRELFGEGEAALCLDAAQKRNAYRASGDKEES